jgi:acyl-CoA thioesterase
MGDLATDAAVVGADGLYTAVLSDEWAAWGPNGGYVAAVLLRAARAHSDFPRAASMTCHFLSVARFAPVEVTAVTLRRSKRAESVRVTMNQDGLPVAEALVWLVAGELDGLTHDVAVMPDVPLPEELRSITELLPDDAPDPPSMWLNIEARPVTWSDEPSEPYYASWYRFPAHTSDDAARQLILLDVMAWSAALAAHGPDSGYVAPNLDLTVQFHQAGTGEEWLLAEGYAEVARDGLIGFRSRVWSRDRRLLSSGSGQLLCRPI